MVQRLSSSLVKHNNLTLAEFLSKAAPFVFPEDFGAVGDGVTDDTNAIRDWVRACADGAAIGMGTKGKTYSHYHLVFKDINNVSLLGGGAQFKNHSGQVGEQLYASGSMMAFVGACQKIRISGMKLDGNRDGSPEYTGFNHGLQFVTGEDDFRSNNGGQVKAMRDILVDDCEFRNMGSFRAGDDKFGDGIYLFGVDGVRIRNSRFYEMGRWGIAGSDVLNVDIEYNYCENVKEGTVALGFIDIENESTDQVNGSFSRNIRVVHNTGKGHCQILVGGGNNDENDLGSDHYLRDVLVAHNDLLLVGGAHAIPNYTTNLIYIGLAPFIKKSNSRGVQNTNIRFSHNTIRCGWADNLSIGFGINAQSTNPAGEGQDATTCTVEGVTFDHNTAIGLSKPYQCAGTSSNIGYTLRKVKVVNNIGKCSGNNSIGIRLAATQLVDYYVHGNDIDGYAVRGLSLEDGRGIGAIDSVGLVSENTFRPAVGVDDKPAVFGNIYRVSMIANTVTAGLAIDMTANVIDKDYGNTWNSLTRTLASFSIAVGSQVARGGINLGSHVRFGYTLTPVPHSLFGQVQITGLVTEQGFGMAVVANLSGDHVSLGETTWTILAEKR